MISKLNVEEKKSSFVWEGKKFEFSSWKLANWCDGSVVVRFADTSLLVTCVMNREPNLESDFLPLAIDFKETFYAWWKIWWAAYTRREWRPSDFAVLTSRLTDRPLRPMFPSGMVNDVVLTITMLSADRENNAWIPSIIWSSLAIMLAWIPFDGPVWAVRIWYKDWNYIINPSYEEIESGIIDIVIAWTKDSITMIECWSKQVSEDILFWAMQLAQTQLALVCKWQEEFLAQFQIEKKEVSFNKPSENLLDYIRSTIPADLLESIYPADKAKYGKIYDECKQIVMSGVKTMIDDPLNDEFTMSKVKMWIFKVLKEFIRNKILKEEKRVDGRGIHQVRPLYTEVGLIPRVHGSGLFQRWETQVLWITTLWAPWDVQLIDTMEHDQIEKRFMHHYNMPPFSTWEAKLSRGTWRRELWHWALAEKAIKYVLPTEEDFPYTIRSVSEVLNSNGSTSMASVCATILALMDAWVPISAPVSGIAMWLISGSNWEYKILTDIQWLEDFVWDMDFKVAGTTAWITALQMDIKIKWLSFEILKTAIERANIWRLDILNFMLQTLDKPRAELNPYAPKIVSIKMNNQQVREVIGPWGSVITDIVKQTWVKIDFKEDWTCIITSKDTQSSDAAIKIIKEIIWVPTINDVIEWTVTRVEAYGAFVTIWKNKQWLCHVKNLWSGFIADAKAVIKEWDKMRVKIIWIDTDGKIQLRKEE